MDVKQMILLPIFWGNWWLPDQGAYNWAEVSSHMGRLVTGRYMDGLNQYGIGRGAVSRIYVHHQDPPSDGFTDYLVQWIFKMAIDNELLPPPDAYDLSTQQPFYCLIVKPGVEHLRDATPDGSVAAYTPDVGTGAYHFSFSYDYGDGRPPWPGQACWVKGDSQVTGTVQRWVHEMAEAYTAGQGEISDTCEGNAHVWIDGVLVPQYWSVVDNACWPPGDTLAVTVGPSVTLTSATHTTHLLLGLPDDKRGPDLE